jgi:hypothetical protein
MLKFLKAIPKYLWLILAAVGGLFMLLAGARRRGAQVGAAKAEAKVESANVEVLVGRAQKANQAFQESQRNPSASESERAQAQAQAESAAEALRDDILRRVSK